MSSVTEKLLEDEITGYLTTNGGYRACKVGTDPGSRKDFEAKIGLDTAELFAFIGHRLDKDPSETWREYGPLFRKLSTSTIPPELLAALAQVESSGNPVDRTYWRWRWSFNPLAIYQPASSAVGLFQMIDGAYAEAAKFCIRDHAVVDSGCGLTSLYIRAIPSHSNQRSATIPALQT